MSCGKHDLKECYRVIRGLPWEFQVRYLQDDEVTPIDLTGCSADLVFFDPNGKDVAPVSFPSQIDVATGGLSWELSEADTKSIPFTHERYRLLLTDSLGVTKPMLRGVVEFEDE